MAKVGRSLVGQSGASKPELLGEGAGVEGMEKLTAPEQNEVIRLLSELKNAVRTEAAMTSASDARNRRNRSSSDEDRQEAAEAGGGDEGDGTWTERGVHETQTSES